MLTSIICAMMILVGYAASIDFNFQLSNTAFDLNDYPVIFDRYLGVLSESKQLDRDSISSLTLVDVVTNLTGSTWESYTEGFFRRNQVPNDAIIKIKAKNFGEIINSIPKYDLDDFWNVPLKVLLLQISQNLEEDGMAEIISLLRDIYNRDPYSIFPEIIGFDVKSPYLLHGYTYMPEIIKQLQYNKTVEILNTYNISAVQLTFISHKLFDEISHVISKEIFLKLHKQNSTKEHNEVKDILTRIHLFQSSLYQWSLSCEHVAANHFLETLDSISQRCFNQKFPRTAFILYNVPTDQSEIYKRLNLEEASALANNRLKTSSLVPMQDLLNDMSEGMNKVQQSLNIPYILLTNQNNISIATMSSQSVGNILTQIHSYSWLLITKIYNIADFISVKAKSIAFIDLAKVVSGDNNGLDIDFKVLKILPLRTILLALSGNVNPLLIKVKFKESVMFMSKKQLVDFKNVFEFSNEEITEATIVSLTEAAFDLTREKFLNYYEITATDYEFFNRTFIKDIGLLLKLQEKDIMFFSITQMISEIKSSIVYSDIMLLSPLLLAQLKKKSVTDVSIFALPQIVHQFKSDVIKSSTEFINFIKEWTKSDAATLMIKEKDLRELSKILTRPLEEVGSMRIVEIVNAVIDSFGSPSSAGTVYCRNLQLCLMTTNGDYRCQCEPGYRFSGPDECSDLDECLYADVTCDKNAECKNTQGSYGCACKSGFEGDGHTCKNINECWLGKYNCAENSFCQDTFGSYKCACKDGFVEGDNNLCLDKDECRLNTYKCHVDGECVNTFGGYECKCKKGYQGNGVTICEDINECENMEKYKCRPNSWCSNTIGSYKCNCLAGFFEEKNFCHQCSDNVQTCHEHASCYKEYFDNFRCVCKAGYSGNGTFCQDYDECLYDRPCGKMGKCRNFIGGHSCLCFNGYEPTFDNKACLDIDECMQSSKLGIVLCNGTDVICVNKEGSYACVSQGTSLAAKVGFGVSIPLIIALAVIAGIIYFRRRSQHGNKELSDFDQKLKSMTNEGYTTFDKTKSPPETTSSKDTGKNVVDGPLKRSGSLTNLFENKPLRYIFSNEKKVKKDDSMSQA